MASLGHNELHNWNAVHFATNLNTNDSTDMNFLNDMSLTRYQNKCAVQIEKNVLLVGVIP